MEREGVPQAGKLNELVPSPSEEQLPRQFGKYTLLRKLAAGGMAELFLALHRSVASFEKLVVIKRILPQMNDDRAFIDMLLHEARIAATLSHPNIVQTFDVGQIESKYFIAMEHIHGEDIRAIVRGMRKKNVVEFPIEHALAIVMGLCSGIAYAHEKRGLDGKLLNIVHRDISPQNIVVTFTGDVKVVDFGVAKSTHVAEEEKGGHLKGKVPYMSPEQARSEQIDHRSDIFAAGVILFELTTGRRLFKGANEYETLKLITERDYPRPSDIAPDYPAALEAIVVRALAKDREQRYQTAREMLADLEAFVREERIGVSTVSLSNFMKMLFEETLAKQNAVLSDVKLLADELVHSSPSHDFNPAMTGLELPSVRTASVATAASVTTASIAPAPAAPKSRIGLGLGLGVGVAAIAGAVYFFATSKPPKPDAATTAAPTTTQTVAAPVVKKATLKVDSKPQGAAVWINGELTATTTPGVLENLPIGAPIQIKLSLEGFESHKETVQFEADALEKSIAPEMNAGSVTVELEIVPPAQVWVDGKPWKGDATKVTGLSADDEHKIAVSASGYVPKTFTFTGKQGETKKLSAVLVKGSGELPVDPKDTKKPDSPSGAPGTVRVSSKGGFCSVTINGTGFGSTPTQASVPSGTARVSCKPESGPGMSQSVKVEPGKTAFVSFVIPN